MKTTIYLSDGGVLNVDDFEDDTALDFREALADPERFVTLDMDGATVCVNVDHIVRVDFETGSC